MAIYMQYEGVKGDATQGKHADWIVLDECSLGAERNIITQVGAAKNRETSEPQVTEVTVNKTLDSSSVLLFQDACINKTGKKVTIDFCSTDDDGPYLSIVLTNALISNYHASSRGGRPTEVISLNFTELDFNETSKNEKNGNGNPVKYHFDVGKGEKK
jgi:type VI secretion system secreted protein Hcp